MSEDERRPVVGQQVHWRQPVDGVVTGVEAWGFEVEYPGVEGWEDGQPGRWSYGFEELDAFEFTDPKPLAGPGELTLPEGMTIRLNTGERLDAALAHGRAEGHKTRVTTTGWYCTGCVAGSGRP